MDMAWRFGHECREKTEPASTIGRGLVPIGLNTLPVKNNEMDGHVGASHKVRRISVIVEEHRKHLFTLS